MERESSSNDPTIPDPSSLPDTPSLPDPRPSSPDPKPTLPERDLPELEKQLFDQNLSRLWRTGAFEEQYQPEEDGMDVDVSVWLLGLVAGPNITFESARPKSENVRSLILL